MSAAPHAAPPAPVSARGVPTAVRARGARIYDDQGRDYIDGSSGPICVNLGHGVPEVLAAMRAQAERVTFAHRSQFGTRCTAELTGEVLAVAGADHREVVYVNSGSEAIETALRLAFHHHAQRGDTDREVVLTQFPSYHGMTAGALGVSGHPGRRAGLAPLHDHSAGTVPVKALDPAAVLPGVAEWEDAFREAGPERVAAVVVEPIGGASTGAAATSPEVLRRLRELCDESGALLVLDEVLASFGRTGDWFGHQPSGVRADLAAIGKGLSSGYTPIGACLVGTAVLPGRTAADFAFGHTMSGNPLSTATALAVLRYTREHDLPARARRVGGELGARLAELTAGSPLFYAPRGRGLLWGLPVVQEAEEYASNPLAPRLCLAARDHGLVVYPAGVAHTTQAVLVAPPLTSTADELDELLLRLERTLRDFGSAV
ncbi:aspartate aminotransferase family protein [Amycolatopsis sp. 195334CR]|uniref:aminotransferase family protein n=1 Tax=Amycolatopsis sp. 195334CR TaxID=2814588 RepID=UPI001A908B39|nr:aminotransferase class III-fold pyridoxal phosphate-dependent enzyme [Amycolatopsis sp. 195334CR]MBN6040420.1 aminotransferase class III-fold pyridoxal phosphate-dependent enzyme [Amycolatopsis sp. 195334CR]